MPFVKWDPFGNVSTLQDRINKVFDDAFARDGSYEAEPSDCSWRPLVDIFDTPNGIVINMEVPGMLKEDVAVEIRENILSIRAFSMIFVLIVMISSPNDSCTVSSIGWISVGFSRKSDTTRTGRLCSSPSCVS